MNVCWQAHSTLPPAEQLSTWRERPRRRRAAVAATTSTAHAAAPRVAARTAQVAAVAPPRARPATLPATSPASHVELCHGLARLGHAAAAGVADRALQRRRRCAGVVPAHAQQSVFRAAHRRHGRHALAVLHQHPGFSTLGSAPWALAFRCQHPRFSTLGSAP